jgi:hypothetical protein
MSTIIENYSEDIDNTYEKIPIEEENNHKEDEDNDVSEDDDEDDEDDDDEDDDDDDDDEDDDDDDDDSYDEYDDIYIISIDNKPYFYQTNHVDAKDKLLDVSKKISKKINESDYFDSYICLKEDDEITIVNRLDFIFFTKHYVLHNLKIHKIRKY